ncbi:hypothetical protein GUITHDRAFT_104529 [Guillardia theta CCMP2712]|uniref:Ubiquitin-like protease family profile domain-containing protein n=1 Tax=Guillardia theta (strain CCMP2712) TaxID=905079 RepID=L1JLW9_GUITC|nr:hypothetical protein GUITHDRAFT_104529 [Guillardia theta CCMP2712]EKX49566.1 hypothetical protein GUITHDRAFT_104529 [Guillardia theta CCMP2712]|eukprot:XP_005836546.1 hypothetical protein GUITHDRAFT_104529 [Guillardia theta CCMP2712]
MGRKVRREGRKLHVRFEARDDGGRARDRDKLRDFEKFLYQNFGNSRVFVPMKSFVLNSLRATGVMLVLPDKLLFAIDGEHENDPTVFSVEPQKDFSKVCLGYVMGSDNLPAMSVCMRSSWRIPEELREFGSNTRSERCCDKTSMLRHPHLLIVWSSKNFQSELQSFLDDNAEVRIARVADGNCQRQRMEAWYRASSPLPSTRASCREAGGVQEEEVIEIDDDSEHEVQVENKDNKRVRLVYPSRSARESVTVNETDVLTLRARQYLNDSIIDFYMKYVQHELSSPVQQSRYHVFGSFFWKRMEQESTLEQKHTAVCRWYKSINIFERDFLFVPICRSLHWTVAVICFPCPDSARCHPSLRGEKEARDQEGGAGIRQRWSKYEHTLLFFDPLGGMLSDEEASRVDTIRELKPYNIPVPTQRNSYDCGLFIMEYVRKFVEDFVAVSDETCSDAYVKFFKWGKNPGSWFSSDNLSETRRQQVRSLILKLNKRHKK